MKVAIIGGGLAGISAARFLAELGSYNITVLEQEKQFGGICRTWIRPDGDRFEFGPHFFHSKAPAVLDRIKPEIAQISYPATIITKSFVNKTLYDYPVSIDNILALPYNEKISVIEELYHTQLSRLKDAATFQDYVTTLVGKTLFKIFFKDYTEKLWGMPANRIPVSWAPQRISFRKEDKRFFCDEWCVYFYDGIEALINYMRERANAREITETNILKIEKQRQWQITTDRGTETFDRIISTIPVTTTLEYLGINQACPLSYRSVIVMYQEVFREEATPADWIYFPEQKYRFTRIFELKRFSGENRLKNKSSITVEIPCAFGDEIWSTPDTELADAVQTQLVDSGLFSQKELGQTEFIRRRYVYPIHDLESSKNLEKSISAIGEYNGIFTTGRLGIFKYMNMDETILRAMETAITAHNSFSKTK